MSEKEKMQAGLAYNWTDPLLLSRQHTAREWMRAYNQTTRLELPLRREILLQLLGKAGEGLWIEPPFFCEYGDQIFMEDQVYINFNCTILDAAAVHIGANTFLGPSVHIYTQSHPLDAEARIQPGSDYAAPVRIGSRVWIGGGVMLCPGVSIGDNTTIGAGSVVTRDIPGNVLAVGNPCRVVREI